MHISPKLIWQESRRSLLAAVALFGAIVGSHVAEPIQPRSVRSKATLTLFQKKHFRTQVKCNPLITKMSDMVFNEYDSTVGYLVGQRSEYVGSLQHTAAALGFTELPRYFWTLVNALPRPSYIVEVRIYHEYPHILTYSFRTETPRDHVEYAINDAASLALTSLKRSDMYPQQQFYFDILTFQVKGSAINEELFGQLILKEANRTTT